MEERSNNLNIISRNIFTMSILTIRKIYKQFFKDFELSVTEN